MTREAKLLSGIILITVPTIQYGGYFLLTSLMNRGSGYVENPLRQNFFRAGHAHAGVIVILSLLCQNLVDAAVLPSPLAWFVRVGVPLSAILISAGFFFSMLPPTATQPNGAISLIYVGAVILAISVLPLAVGLVRVPRPAQDRKNRETVASEELRVAEACNHPNCLMLPCRLELIRRASACEVKGHRLAIASV